MAPPTQTINLAIADDHPIVRFGLKAALVRDPRIRIALEAADGRELLRSMHDGIDVVLLDLAMPRMDGYEVLRRLKDEFPEVRVIIMSALAGKDAIDKARQNGASGFLSKNELAASVSKAIRTVQRGKSYFSPALRANQLVNVNTGPDLGDLLTEREKDILRLLSNGYKNKEIADELDLSIRTVEFHRANIKTKLNSTNTTELVKTAIQQNLV